MIHENKSYQAGPSAGGGNQNAEERRPLSCWADPAAEMALESAQSQEGRT